eukprot:TRINITY_DN552_c2_g1_i1.p1 TRINITY_DN552_c2_g1~~TRINITY_DN552_c2_g1_i1.p1  ORF type:complete len:385 (-),score=112.79 TRINITY_DN552_c2_g1_i1:101-1255(-)
MAKVFEAKGLSVVFDNGTYNFRAGIGGDDSPRVVFQNIIGRPKNNLNTYISGQRDFYVGEEAQSNREILALKYPMDYGMVNNWDDMEKIWHHTYYNELNILPEENTILLTEHSLNPKINREKMTQIFFETFNVPSMYSADKAVLSLYSSGRSTGIVFDSGSFSTIVPVYQGQSIRKAISVLDIGGNDIRHYLQKLGAERGYTFTSYEERKFLNDYKEKFAYVALDFDQEMQIASSSVEDFEKSYKLQNGEMCCYGNERFRCTEILFQPTYIGIEMPGIHQLFYNSIQKCESDIRGDLYNNIILSGGNTMFPGLSERIHNELTAFAPPNTNINIIDPDPSNRSNYTWLGASLLSKEQKFLNMCISMEDYDEYGPTIIHRCNNITI